MYTQSAPEWMAYDAIRVKLWQPWRGCTAGLHNVNKDVHILAVAFPSSISLRFDVFLMPPVPLSPRTTGYVGNGAHLLSAAVTPRITDNGAETRSRTEFCKELCSVPATQKREDISRTKSERQIRLLGSDPDGVEEEVAGVPANLRRWLDPGQRSRACLRYMHRLIRVSMSNGFRDVGHFRDDDCSGGNRFSPRPEVSIADVISREVTTGSIAVRPCGWEADYRGKNVAKRSPTRKLLYVSVESYLVERNWANVGT